MVNNSRLYDAVIVGAGPNGLAAAIKLAQAGRSVLVIEGQATIGGGAKFTWFPARCLFGDSPAGGGVAFF